ncbi:MAG: hypothetical protein GWM98_11960, partial [Nitrospinaceae bacterium]|nr:hypothetical protein [Nitrospinaceae bacterium]NIR54738.1 hypothetical protein [Nitrospinaceae bacterium]NIS85163.1 hypothetical protein [Nitrospinaceae bacterium]NIT82330.1 hypothetical protein [Nitrospinaceae bacterium]NIU44237.1 hypothetical protein [Nitrospinaceae bacterium]
DNDLETLRRALWYETDLRYKQAIMNFLKKKGRFISGVEDHQLADFSSGHEPTVRIDPVPPFDQDLKSWEDLVRDISKVFREAPQIEKSRVKFHGDRVVRHYLDSEGNKLRTADLQFGIELEAWTKTDSGSPIHDQETLYFSRLDRIPSREKL